MHAMQQTSNPDRSPWLTAIQVADLFGVSRNTVRNWANDDRIPHHRLPSGRLRFRRDEIEPLLGESA